MAIAVNFWRYAGSPKRIDKALSATPDLVKNSVTPFEPLDELRGYVIMEYDEIYYEMTMAGMGWKYYHITDRTALPGGRIRLDLMVDVLYTYRTDMMNCNVWCKRSAVKQTPYITDQRAPIESRKIVSATPLQEISAHSTDMIIITVG